MGRRNRTRVVGIEQRRLGPFRNGAGTNATGFDCVRPPQLGYNWQSSVPTTANTFGTYVGVGLLPSSGTILFGGEVLVSMAPTLAMLAGNGVHSVPLPGVSAFIGLQLYSQGIRLDITGGAAQVTLFNAQDLTLGL